MMSKRIGLCAVAVLLAGAVYAQPLNGTPIEMAGLLPTLSDAGFTPVNQEVPLLLGQDPDNDDREPKTCVLANGAAIVYWVNRGGSHHFSGMNPDGSRIYDVFGAGADDVIIGSNTGENTNWTICVPSDDGTKFLVASTYKFGQLSGTGVSIPATVGDADGVNIDDGQGHGFFKVFDSSFNEVTSGPTSVGQISLGHRDWGAGGLSDGKWAIGVMSRDHRWAFDPDGSASSRTPFLNIFNADGSRAVDEFAPTVQAGQGEVTVDLSGDQSGRFHIAPLSDGFAYKIHPNGANPGVFIIYDNDGNVVNSYPTADDTVFPGTDVREWSAGAGGNMFVAIFTPTVTQDMVDAGIPADMLETSVLLARRFDKFGPVGDYILVNPSSADDVGGPDRPRVAMAPNGSFAVSWGDAYSDEVTMQESVAFRVFNADGTPASTACLAHDLPEVVIEGEPGAGEPGEPMIGMNDELVSVAWASRAFSGGTNRDVVVNVVANPAEGTDVKTWELY